MARKPRIFYPGAVYHVMLRGNRGMQIFLCEEDRDYFYCLIKEGVRRYGYEIHGFCLMSNHVHLLLRIGTVNLSKVIQNISFRYTRWFNKREHRTGHLFQGRYKAILVDEESYVLELIRYIHLNPVRANLVNKVDDYHWSSHRVYLGLDELSWLTTDWVLSRFGNERILALSNYLQFIMKKDSKLLDEYFHKGNQRGYDVLAENSFMEKINMKTKFERKIHVDLENLVKLVCDYFKVSIRDLQSDSRMRAHAKTRAFIALVAQEFNQCTLTSVAAYFRRDISGMIKTIRRLHEHNTTKVELCKLKEFIEKSTSQA